MDVDIDTQTSFNSEKVFNWVRASIVKDNLLVPHPCGVHPQNIPEDGITKLSAIPYSECEKFGYFKIDFLHLNVYNYFETQNEITIALKENVNWDMLLDENVCKKLFQLSNHFDILNKIRPKSIIELADVLALIRPGKAKLISLYLANRDSTRKILYKKDNSSYYFKKSHAIAYAHVILLQLYLINHKKL